MKLKFDPNQQFQLDAIDAIVNVFEGLPLKQSGFEVNVADTYTGMLKNLERNDLGFGNHFFLGDEQLLKNTHIIQSRNDIKQTPSLQGLNFSVEMETGTGKTYVYLRTILELYKKYGFLKFVIVVPSVAIREGTLKNIEITKDHFRRLYDNVSFGYAVYDSKNMSIVKNFATSNHLQLLIINIDAFRKDFSDTEEEEKGVLFHRPSEKLNGRCPRDFVQAVHPIVIIDEPQSVDTTPLAKQAIKSLNPLCMLRYSATHINPYNLVYRLDPVKAYSMKLVKKIAVASVIDEEGFGEAYVKLIDVDNTNGLRAKIEYHQETNSGPNIKKGWVKQGVDLFDLSNKRECYRDGYQISEICAEPDNEYITFSPSNIKLRIGEGRGGYDDETKRIQIRNTIKEHLDKELQVGNKGIKVLTLFFIDRVANYRNYTEDRIAEKGKYAQWFEEEYSNLIKQSEYKKLNKYPVEELHNGYFAQDKDGQWKDSSGKTKADESTYDKIMKNKEQLLSLDEPLRFIFSHSALREGWDNPNVFQICTLNERQSALTKRQEIGRGMRLPVNQNGERVFDDSINKLVVMANESYKDFAGKLQTEYETECGIKFGLVPKNAFADIHRVKRGKDVEVGLEESEKIWENLRAKGYIDDEGTILGKFNPDDPEFQLKINKRYDDINLEVLEKISSYRLERHITKHKSPRKIKLNKRIFLDAGFKELWERINQKTTFSVNYSSKDLIDKSVTAIGEMPRVRPVKIQYMKAEIDVDERGVGTREVRNQITEIEKSIMLPDILSYLQRATNLTRKTLYNILAESGRLDTFSINPQKFMDQIVDIIKNELSQLIIRGIKYEKIAGEEYEMQLFEEGEITSYLNSLLESKKSVYNYVEYDSEVEKKFALELENKEHVKLFVKLPSWFKVDTPVGTYNPDWAILKHNDETLYLVRETKGTKDFTKLRNSEAYKIRCGEKHFEELGVDFETVTDASRI